MLTHAAAAWLQLGQFGKPLERFHTVSWLWWSCIFRRMLGKEMMSVSFLCNMFWATLRWQYLRQNESLITLDRSGHKQWPKLNTSAVQAFIAHLTPWMIAEPAAKLPSNILNLRPPPPQLQCNHSRYQHIFTGQQLVSPRISARPKKLYLQNFLGRMKNETVLTFSQRNVNRT